MNKTVWKCLDCGCFTMAWDKDDAVKNLASFAPRCKGWYNTTHRVVFYRHQLERHARGIAK
jgi:hypothetical protein